MHASILCDVNALAPFHGLLASEVGSSPFASWGFLQTWLEAHADTSRPFVIVVHGEDDGVLAIAPWCICTEKGGLRRLTGIGGTDGWYHDPRLFHPCRAREVARCLVKALRQYRQLWDVVDLVLRDSVSAPLIAGLRIVGFSLSERIDWRQHQTARIASDWQTYWNARPAQLRNLVTRCGKKLAALPHRFVQVDEHSLSTHLETLFGLHHQRWASERDWIPYYSLVRAIANEALRERRLCFYVLEVEGQPIALELLVRCADQAFELMRIIRPESAYTGLSPGSLLTAWALERMVADGIREVNLGPGIQPWKSFLETTRTASVRCQVLKPSAVPRTLFGHWELFKPYLRSLPLLQRMRTACQASRPCPLRLPAKPQALSRIHQGLS